MKKKISALNQKRLDTLACYLRELRLNEGMTQKDVESIHRNTISRIEQAKSFNLVSLFEICDFYGIEASELLDII